MDPVLEKQRAELSKTLDTLKSQQEISERGIAEVQRHLAEIRQTVATIQLSSNRAAEGEHGESAVYTRVREVDVKSAPSHYLKGDAGVVRLTGHVAGEAGQLWGLLDDPHPADSAQRHLQEAVARRGLIRRIIAADRKIDEATVYTPRSDREVERAIAALPGKIAKIFSASAGIGLEILPTRTSPDLEREVLAKSGLTSMFAVHEHPGGVLQLPYISGVLQAFAGAVPTTDTPSNDTPSSLGSGVTTISLASTAVHAVVHRDAAEDALQAILPQIYADIADALAFADDNTMINGHTAGTQDALATWNVRGRMATMGAGVTSQLRRWDGFRKLALAGGAASSASLASANALAGFMSIVNLLGVEQLMDADGKSRIVILVNPEYFFKTILNGWTEFTTWNAVGALATILSGRLGPEAPMGGMLPNQVGYLYNRFPVCLAYPLTKDLNASGVWDNTTTTKTGMLVVDRERYEQWYKPGATVETDVEIRNNTIAIVGRKRNVMRPKRLGTGQYVAAYGYNLPT